jgi:large subunit ribosomal protein L21
MYAVIASGGKQYKVAEGQILKLEKIAVDTGREIEFDQILLLADEDNIKMGMPYLKDVRVKAEIVAHGRGKKIHVIKFRRRKHHLKRQGHRQGYTQVKIIGIEAGKKTSQKSGENSEE